MRVLKSNNEVQFITKDTYGMSFWLTCYIKDTREPRVCMDVSGEGHTSVSGRYSQSMTVEELGEFIKQANVLYESIKHLEVKEEYKLTTHLTVKDFKKYRNKLNVMGSPWQNSETESSIRWLLKFAIDKGDFNPFNLSELQDYYEKNLGKKEEFWFNKLRNPEDIVRTNNNKVFFTDFFINECYKLLIRK